MYFFFVLMHLIFAISNFSLQDFVSGILLYFQNQPIFSKINKVQMRLQNEMCSMHCSAQGLTKIGFGPWVSNASEN